MSHSVSSDRIGQRFAGTIELSVAPMFYGFRSGAKLFVGNFSMEIFFLRK